MGRSLEAIEADADGKFVFCEYHPGFMEEHALREIYSTYGDVVEIKPKALHKFGENLLVGTEEATLMTLPAGVLSETYVSTNATTHISSSDSGDTQSVKVEGHTVSGGLFTFVVQTITLAGQTKVALATPLARVTRLENAGAVDFAGIVYVFEDDTLTGGVPDTAAKVHIIANNGENQTLKAATTISNEDYCLVTQIYASINKKTAAGAVVRFRVRTAGGVFQTKYKIGINSVGGGFVRDLWPYLIVPQNSDITMSAEADGANTAVAGGFNSILATVVRDN